MRNKNFNILFCLAYAVKVLVSAFVLGVQLGVAYSLCFSVIFSYLLHKKSNLIYFVTLIMIDFLFIALASSDFISVSMASLGLSLRYFVLANGLLYSLSINYLAIETSAKKLKYRSDLEIDKGIKALEEQDYDKAIAAFTSAIKEHKQNYLGYVGMCNVLSETDKKSLRKYKYYKKKSLRYAPKHIKEELKNKY